MNSDNTLSSVVLDEEFENLIKKYEIVRQAEILEEGGDGQKTFCR